MKKVLLKRWESLFRGVETDFKSALDLLVDRRCPVCGFLTPDLQQESGVYRCPENEEHGFLEFRKSKTQNRGDFFCHHCNKSLWEWEEGAKHCPHCKLPFTVIPLMELAENTLPRFSKPISASDGTSVPHAEEKGFLNQIRARLGLR